MNLTTTRQQYRIGTAVLLVGLYLTVTFSAFLCASSHDQHHATSTHHSLLCAWACQFNSSVSLISLHAPTKPTVFIQWLWVSSLIPSVLIPSFFTSARAPPYPLFS